MNRFRLIAKLKLVILEQFKTHLETFLPELYGFAFALISDDLQAQQLVLDSVSKLSLEHKDLVLNTFECDEEQRSLELLEVKKVMLKAIWDLAFKRTSQLAPFGEDQIESVQDKRFFQRDLHERGVLLLKHQLNFGFDEIESIIQLPRHEIISKLYSGRSVLSQKTI